MSLPGPLANTVLVAVGGGAGAALRYQAGRLLTLILGAPRVAAFPWATLTVNVVGSMAMGLLIGWLSRHGNGGETMRLLLGVGVLGGFTTFSAFSLEMVMLLQRGQSGTAMTYALLSISGGIFGLFLGLALTRATV